MYSFKLIYFLIFILNLYKLSCQRSGKSECYDEKCSVPLSTAITLLLYNRAEPGLLSFKPNQDVTIYSKEVGTKTGLWGAEIGGRRGYVNQMHVREQKILNTPNVLVDTKFNENPQVPIKQTEGIRPDNVKQPHEVIDGTTIYNDFYGNTNPTKENPSFSNSETAEKQKENSPQPTKVESVVDSVISSISNIWNDDEEIDDDVSVEDDDDDDGEDEEDDVEDVDDPASDNDMHMKKEFKPDTPKMEPSNNSRESVDSKHGHKLNDKSVENKDTDPSTGPIPQQRNEQEQVHSKSGQKVGDKSVEKNGTDPSTDQKPQQKNEQEQVNSKSEQKIGDNGTDPSLSTEQKPQQNNEQEQVRSKSGQKVGDKSVENNGTDPSTDQKPQQTNEQEQVYSKSEHKVSDKSVENNDTDSSTKPKPQQKNEQEQVYSKSEQKVGDKSVENNGTEPSTDQKLQQKNEQEQVDSRSDRKLRVKSVENNGSDPSLSTEQKPQQKNEQEQAYSKGEQKVNDKSVEKNGPDPSSSTEQKSQQINQQEQVDSVKINNIVSNLATKQVPQQQTDQKPAMDSKNVGSTTTPTSIEEIPPPFVNFDEVTPNPVNIEPGVEEVKSYSPSAPKLRATKENNPLDTVGQAPSELPKMEDGLSKLTSNVPVQIDNQAPSGKSEAKPEPQLGATLPEKTVTENAPEHKLDATSTNETISDPSLSTTKLDDPAVVETSNNTSSSRLGDHIGNETKPAMPKDYARLGDAEATTVPTLEDIPKLPVFGSLFGSQVAPREPVVENVPESNDSGQNSAETTPQLDSATSISQDVLSKIEDAPVSKDVSEEETNSEAIVTNFESGVDGNAAHETPNDNQLAVEELPNAAIISSEEKTTGDITVDTNEVPNDNSGFIASLYSFFQEYTSDPSSNTDPHSPPLSRAEETLEENVWASPESSCTRSVKGDSLTDVIFGFNSDFLLYLITTAISCIVFLFVYLAIDRNRREAPLVARINKLEKDLQVCMKENELLQERPPAVEENTVPNEVVENLQWKLSELQERKSHLELQVTHLQSEVGKKAALEEQIESLEKELETSTEVGMELTRIISEMLDSTDGSDKLKENMDQLQRQLLGQKDTINKLSAALSAKEMENCALHDDLQDGKRRVDDLQQRYDDVRGKLTTLQGEMERQRDAMQRDITMYRQKYDDTFRKNEQLNTDIQVLKVQLSDLSRQAELKTKEYDTLKESIGNIKSMKGEDAIRSLLDSTTMTAKLEQLKSENERFLLQTRQDQLRIDEYERKYRSVQEDVDTLTRKYEEADKDKTEANMKLEVLNNYFKKRESELQEEVLKYKSIFDAKEGAATSTSERMKLLQEEIENYKSQNETLKQEIISQEIDLKSQISVLEKKVHENWVTARQTERRLEDSRHEAAQLRNRLTLQNRGGFDDMRTQNRVQSPVDQNGDTTLSPHPSIDSPASPPLLYTTRDHITQSPPLPALPPPFLPPPPGAPFMPPPLPGMPHFMPPPPAMFPGDHRPPPLGRMSSPPPMNSRYSPGPLGFSPYDRNSPSPPYDSEYGTSPPVRGYSPFNGRDDRRDYKRPPPSRNKGRNMKGSTMSSGSEHSNDSLDKMNRKQSKMV